MLATHFMPPSFDSSPYHFSDNCPQLDRDGPSAVVSEGANYDSTNSDIKFSLRIYIWL
jgi:hypothetical protein